MNASNGMKAILDRALEKGSERFLPEDILAHFRGLVGQIEVALPNRDSRLLLLSSSVSGEGTTEVVVGLGIALASAMGKKTAIVDCNFRHPDVHNRLGTPAIGLGEYMAGEIGFDKALASTSVPNLSVMGAGQRTGSLFAAGSQEIERFLDDLRSRFEYVLIDAAPVGTDLESAVLCNKVDSVILVVRHGSTKREVVRATTDMIARAGGRVLGVVLNRRRFPIPDFLYKRL
jgi:protein-tyrosine kinase